MTSEYRRGVEDATKNFSGSELNNSGFSVNIEDFEKTNKALANRRKTLLTKKVTKWVNIYAINTAVCNESVILYDTKEEAEKNSYYGRLIPYHSTHLIEIELPID